MVICCWILSFKFVIDQRQRVSLSFVIIYKAKQGKLTIRQQTFSIFHFYFFRRHATIIIQVDEHISQVKVPIFNKRNVLRTFSLNKIYVCFFSSLLLYDMLRNKRMKYYYYYITQTEIKVKIMHFMKYLC